MLILRGSPALSSFRLSKLLQEVAAAGLPAVAISAEFVHVVDLGGGTLSAAERGVLEKLLTYGPSRVAEPISGLVQFVAPRPGTISPWSSKATDIAHICGLAAVRRIERVIAYTIAFDSGYALPATQGPLLTARLHDRMTQVVFGDLDACGALFRHETPRPMTGVPVLTVEYAVSTSSSPGRTSGSPTSLTTGSPSCAKTRSTRFAPLI
ncbi:MAG: hypothetical protein WCL04_01760, partial [Verrucomicrobiota bacterium]